MTTTDSLRAALKRLAIMAGNELDTPGLWAHDRSQWNDAIAAARAALAQPEPALAQRPGCFEFALDFLGSPENDQLREYIEQLEARAALAEPVADGPAVPESREPASVTGDPTDEQLLATVDAVSVTLPPLPDAHGRINYDIAWRVAMARAVLARWGGQAAPVPMAERLPEPVDCDAEGRCWWGFEETDDYEASWTLRKMIGLPFDDTHWLPATALPLPAGEVQ